MYQELHPCRAMSIGSVKINANEERMPQTCNQPQAWVSLVQTFNPQQSVGQHSLVSWCTVHSTVLGWVRLFLIWLRKLRCRCLLKGGAESSAHSDISPACTQSFTSTSTCSVYWLSQNTLLYLPPKVTKHSFPFIAPGYWDCLTVCVAYKEWDMNWRKWDWEEKADKSRCKHIVHFCSSHSRAQL